MDFSSLEKLKERIDELAKAQLKVGILAQNSASRGGGVNQAGLAAAHELGAPEAGIPSRSFMRSTFRAKKGYSPLISKQLQKVVVDELSVEKCFEAVGKQMVSDIRQTIAKGISPALKPQTIRNKGGNSVPLIDTGSLMDSIDYEVK